MNGLTTRNSRRLRFQRLEPRYLLAGIVMTDEEQLVLEYINRARADPPAEAARFGIGLNEGLPSGTISPNPKPPLAPNQILTDVAVAHSQDMIDRNFFDHVNPDGKGPGDRLTAAGYIWSAYGENIAWVFSLDQFHEILFLSETGHRQSMLSEAYLEVGIGLRYYAPGQQPPTYGPLKGTESFATSWGDAFITGLVYSDQVVENNFFTPGEGLAGVTVTATNVSSGASVSTPSGPTGAYSLEVPDGTYNVVATGGDLGAPLLVSGVTIAESNVKVDFIPSAVPPIPPTAADDRALVWLNQPTSIDVLANDVGEAPLAAGTVVVTTAPGHGSIDVDETTGAITYRPQTGFTGVDELRYHVSDTAGTQSNEATVTIVVVAASAQPWQNPADRFDVTADGVVNAQDVLQLVNDLNDQGPRQLTLPDAAGAFPPPYLDVSGDGSITPVDVLDVINHINVQLSGEGEGETGHVRASSAESLSLYARGLQTPNATCFVPGQRDPQGASRGFWAGKRNLCSPSASAVPLEDWVTPGIAPDVLESILDAILLESRSFWRRAPTVGRGLLTTGSPTGKL